MLFLPAVRLFDWCLLFHGFLDVIWTLFGTAIDDTLSEGVGVRATYLLLLICTVVLNVSLIDV